jgi:hypothetical protein
MIRGELTEVWRVMSRQVPQPGRVLRTRLRWRSVRAGEVPALPFQHFSAGHPVKCGSPALRGPGGKFGGPQNTLCISMEKELSIPRKLKIVFGIVFRHNDD